jgi:hypothetical protein
MAELKPFEVIMRLSPYAPVNSKNEICFHAEKVSELVRCKDCKWIDLCKDPEYYEYKGANGFCSRGERRENEE